MRLSLRTCHQRRAEFFYFFICLTVLTTACQEHLPREHSLFSEKVGAPSTYLDSLADPLFSRLVRDSLLENPYGFTANEIITYADTVYAARICDISSALPLVYDEDVQDYINLYAMRKKDLTERMIGKSAWYYPVIERMLADEQMPDALKHLVMVESAMNAKAVSYKSAVGLWQIRPATGRELGLEVSDWVDERRDPFASSRAAISYLKSLHERYQDWYLAIAAYNYGIGNMSKAMARAQANEARVPQDFWELRKYLPKETRSYIPAFIAVVYLYHHQQEHNLRPAYFQLPFRQVDTLLVQAPTTFDEISEATGVSHDILNFLNPSFVRGVLPQDEQYALALPANKPARWVTHNQPMPPARIDSSYTWEVAQIIRRPLRVVPNPEKMISLVHLIESGHTLGSIAEQYNCTVDDLVKWNSLYEPIIRSGDELTVYVPRQQFGEATFVRR